MCNDVKLGLVVDWLLSFPRALRFESAAGWNRD